MRRERRRKFIRDRRRVEDEILWCKVPSISWIASSPMDRALVCQQKVLMNWQRTRNVRQFQSECDWVRNAFEWSSTNDNHRVGDGAFACLLNNLAFTCSHWSENEFAVDLLKQAI